MHMARSNSPPNARKGDTKTYSRNNKVAEAPKQTQAEVYRTYPSATGPKHLTPAQIKKALKAA